MNYLFLGNTTAVVLRLVAVIRLLRIQRRHGLRWISGSRNRGDLNFAAVTFYGNQLSK